MQDNLQPTSAPPAVEASVKDYGAQVMTTAVDADDSAPTSEPDTAINTKKVRVRVPDILQGGREAILEHDGQEYRLRITANGKLILTK